MHAGDLSTPNGRAAVVLGVFVGGRARRMGGQDKASLPAPDGSGSLLRRQVRLGRALGFEVVLLGARLQVPDPDPELLRLPDAPAGVGPLGGLGPLLRHAGERVVIATACDMPYVGEALLTRLVQTPCEADVLAPRVPGSDKWMPLCARYRPARVLPALEAALAAGDRSFQYLLRRLTVQELPVSAAQWAELEDWDRPEDVVVSGGGD